MRKTRLLLIAVPLVVLMAAATAISASQLLQQPLSDPQSIPQTVTYQGVLTDANGGPVNNGPYSVHFHLYTQPDGGSPVWSERHEVDVQGGLFSIALGTQQDLSVALQNGPELYLGLTVASGSELRPRQPITSVPFALSARDAETLNGLSAQEITDNALASGAGVDCALERRLATAVDRYSAPSECLPSANAVEDAAARVTPSIAVRSDGVPVVAYVDADDRLRLVICVDQACSTFVPLSALPEIFVEGEITLALDSQDRPAVSYMDAETNNLAIVVCASDQCSSPTVSVIDDRPESSPNSFSAAGRFHDMVIIQGDLPRIQYVRERNRQEDDGGIAITALCRDRLCEEVTLKESASTFSSSAPDNPDVYAGPGFIPSLTVKPDGSLIAVTINKARLDFAGDRLTFLRCDNPECESLFGSGLAAEFDGATSTAISIAPDNNQVAASTIDDTVVYMRCTGFNCSNNLQVRPDHTGSGGIIRTQGFSGHINAAPAIVEGVSLEVLPGASVLLAYNDFNVGVMVARCANVECDTAPAATRIGKDTVGGTDMALAPDGTPFITYLAIDRQTGNLFPQVFKCENCSSW